MRVYSVYGLRLASNLDIPGLVIADNPGSPDVSVFFAEEPPVLRQGELVYQSPCCVDDDPPLRVWACGTSFRLLYSDGVEFFLDCHAGRIWSRWPEDRTHADAIFYLLGPVLGLFLRKRDILCLHASAIRFGDQAILISGPIRSGKSTTAAALASRGNLVISEDLVVLQEQTGRFLVRPGYPRIRLWPDSVNALFGSPDALPRLMPGWEKRFLDLIELRAFCLDPAPIAAVYVMNPRSPDSDAPRIEPFQEREKPFALAANTYSNYLLDIGMREREFNVLARLARSVPVLRLTPHSDPDRIGALCDLLNNDVERLKAC